MSKKFGFDLLLKQALEEVSVDLSYIASTSPGDSEIERLLFAAVKLICRLRLSEHQNLVDITESGLPNGCVEAASPTLFVHRQAQLPFGRVDFIFHTCDPNGSWHRLIVECDGHDFHERTKEQAARDKSRDRHTVMAGYKVFRFTGSEIWRDPMGCAQQVSDWAVRSWWGM